MSRFTRRRFVQGGAWAAMGAAASSCLPWEGLLRGASADEPVEKLPVAGVTTEYRKNSHADVLLGKILEGYLQDGGPGPGLKLVSLYVDQVPANDLSRGLAEKHGFRLAKSIDEALTLGTDELQVAGVLNVGEHGNYPRTDDTKQTKYPRRRFFDDVVAAFRRVGKTVPVFNDKHLSYRWEDARFMVDTAREMKFPLLAGSSAPVAWREPAEELPRDLEIDEALTIGYGGFESYGFHALEAHQSIVERRRGGETGVVSVQAVRGEGILKALEAGRWSRSLFEAALKATPDAPAPTLDWARMGDHAAAYLFTHRDGLKSAVLMANGLSRRLSVAVRARGRDEPIATWFRLQDGPPYGHFAYLANAFEHTIRTGRAVYPVERTLLTTGILDRVMHSLAADGKVFETPELDVRYTASDWPFANHPASKLKLTGKSVSSK